MCHCIAKHKASQMRFPIEHLLRNVARSWVHSAQRCFLIQSDIGMNTVPNSTNIALTSICHCHWSARHSARSSFLATTARRRSSRVCVSRSCTPVFASAMCRTNRTRFVSKWIGSLNAERLTCPVPDQQTICAPKVRHPVA